MYYPKLSATLNDFLRVMPAEFRFNALLNKFRQEEHLDEDTATWRVDEMACEANDMEVAGLAWNKIFG